MLLYSFHVFVYKRFLRIIFCYLRQTENIFDNQKLFFVFLFLRIENNVFLQNTF